MNYEKVMLFSRLAASVMIPFIQAISKEITITEYINCKK